MTPTDAALVARIAADDSSALAELMAVHGPPLMRFASHFLRSSADADEVLQDVFVRAERAIRRGTRPDRLDSWLFTITINRCRSRRRRWRLLVFGPPAQYALDRAVAPTLDASAVATREEVDRAVATLSPPLREAFLLKHVEGMEYQEMAAITGASVPALKMRVARACEQLRNLLKEIRS